MTTTVYYNHCNVAYDSKFQVFDGRHDASPMPMMDPAASDWRNLTAEVLRKVVDLLQPQDTAASAFASKKTYLSSFQRVCPRWLDAASKSLVPAWSTY